MTRCGGAPRPLWLVAAPTYIRRRSTRPRASKLPAYVQPEGDTVFPGIDPAQWREAARQDYAAGPDDEAPFTALTYERRDLRKTS